MAMTVLSQRVLSRTLLERQLLVRRSACSALEAIERLVAVQAQEPNWPYVGLWTRLADFRPADLMALLDDRRVVRGGLIRRTKHLASSADYLWLRPLVQLPNFSGGPRRGLYGRETAGLDMAALADASRELMSGRMLTGPQLGRLLAERFPGRDWVVLMGSAQFLVAVVHAPPGGAWGSWGIRGGTSFVLAEEWLGRPMAVSPRIETLIRRYLAAFGPASVMDMQAWSGVTRLRDQVDGLRSELRVFHTEQGTELFDLPDAALADPELPVPVRFLPAYDNLLLGHADRTRIIRDEDRKLVAPGRALVLPTFLVDGFVHGTWSLKGATLRICPFRPLARSDTAAVLAEAERLLDFVGYGVRGVIEWTMGG
jgi:hypothetical protein